MALLGTSWLLVLGGFVVVSWLATRVAHADGVPGRAVRGPRGVRGRGVDHLRAPAADRPGHGPGGDPERGHGHAFGFTGLTVVVFATRKDFSFLGGLLGWCGVVALILIVAGVVFGFELGTFFSVAMIALAGGAVLHDTSKVLHHYPEDRYVGGVARAVRLGGAACSGTCCGSTCRGGTSASTRSSGRPAIRGRRPALPRAVAAG